MATNPKFVRVRSVTQAVLKLLKGQPRYLFLIDPMTKGKAIDDKKEPATLIHAVDMETGEEGVLIAPMVLQRELFENYPSESYVGKGFEITITRDPEKKYNHVSIAEVAVPEDFRAPPSTAALLAKAAQAASATKAAPAAGKAAK